VNNSCMEPQAALKPLAKDGDGAVMAFDARGHGTAPPLSPRRVGFMC